MVLFKYPEGSNIGIQGYLNGSPKPFLLLANVMRTILSIFLTFIVIGTCYGGDKIRLGIIVVGTLDEAMRVKEEILGGKETFSDLARRHSIGPGARDGGDLGDVDIEELEEPFKRIVLGLREGETSPIVEMPSGFAILKVLSRKGVETKIEPSIQTHQDVPTRGDEWRRYLMEGISYLMKDELDRGIEALERALSMNPENPDVRYNLGLAYAQKGWTERAITEYKKAIEKRPDFIDALLNLGVAYSERGFIDRAIEEFKKVIDLSPENGKAHNNLAISYFLKRDYSEAIRHCDRAVELGEKVHPEFLKELEPYRHKGKNN